MGENKKNLHKEPRLYAVFFEFTEYP